MNYKLHFLHFQNFIDKSEYKTMYMFVYFCKHTTDWITYQNNGEWTYVYNIYKIIITRQCSYWKDFLVAFDHNKDVKYCVIQLKFPTRSSIWGSIELLKCICRSILWRSKQALVCTDVCLDNCQWWPPWIELKGIKWPSRYRGFSDKLF